MTNLPTTETETEALNLFRIEALELLETHTYGLLLLDGKCIGEAEIKADWELARRVIAKLAD